jgi:hypothetical protein
MSVHDRLKLVNLRVESFLDANNAPGLKDAWYARENQAQVLALLDPFAPSITPTALTVVIGTKATPVPRNIKKLTLGCHPVSNPATHALGLHVENAALEHVLVTQFGRHSYKVFVKAPTWVRVGEQFPLSLEVPPVLPQSHPSVYARTGLILQPTSLFHIASHTFHIVNAPLLLKRHANHLPAASRSFHAELATFDRVAEEIEQSEDAFCMVQCVAPQTSPLYHQVWRLPYGKGHVSWSVGSGDKCTIRVESAWDPGIAPVHCRIHALMGYFWLLGGWASNGTYVFQHADAPPLTLKSGHPHTVTLLLGGTEVTLVMT